MITEKFLNGQRTQELWTKIKAALGGKQDRLTGGFGQVVGFSAAGAPEAQYLTLGQVQDGNPVGSVISFLGQTAPAGYLVCDGTSHSISDYPALADFFRQQFGAANHFGGDGETTFAVPDMRNLFLRGFHGEAEERLSGNVGAKQEGTVFPALFAGGGSAGRAPSVMTEVPANSTQSFEHPDTCEGNPSSYTYNTAPWAANTISESGAGIYANSYTARPVNMAVLYCIKAV